jgi:hypothetical protein
LPKCFFNKDNNNIIKKENDNKILNNVMQRDKASEYAYSPEI